MLHYLSVGTPPLHELIQQWTTRGPLINDQRGNLRFGQWVFNTYSVLDKSWPELYYADTHKAQNILVSYFIEYPIMDFKTE